MNLELELPGFLYPLFCWSQSTVIITNTVKVGLDDKVNCKFHHVQFVQPQSSFSTVLYHAQSIVALKSFHENKWYVIGSFIRAIPKVLARDERWPMYKYLFMVKLSGGLGQKSPIANPLPFCVHNRLH